MKLNRLLNYGEIIDEYYVESMSIAGWHSFYGLTEFLAQNPNNAMIDFVDLKCTYADLLLDGEISAFNNLPTVWGDPAVADEVDLMFTLTSDEAEEILKVDSGSTRMFRLNSTTVDAGGDEVIWGALQEFKTPDVKAYTLDSVTLNVDNFLPDHDDGHLFVDIYNRKCNRTIFLVDTAYALVDDGYVGDVVLEFQHKNTILQDTIYFMNVRVEGTDIEIQVTDEDDKIAIYGPTLPNLINLTQTIKYRDPDLYNKNSVNYYLDKMFNVTHEEMQVETNVSVLDIRIKMDSTWVVKLESDVVIFMDDGFSQYDNFQTLVSYVNINGLPEPLAWQSRLTFTCPTCYDDADFIINLSNIPEYEYNISNIANLSREKQYWRNDDYAPNYLQRLMNWTNVSVPAAFGFETIISERLLDDVDSNSNSSIDWIYFNGTTTNCHDIYYINNSKIRDDLAGTNQITDDDMDFLDEHGYCQIPDPGPGDCDPDPAGPFVGIENALVIDWQNSGRLGLGNYRISTCPPTP